MSTYKETLDLATKKALESNKEDSAVKILLMHHSNMESHELLQKLDEEFDNTNFLIDLDKYITDNIPVQHLVGYDFFYGHKFIVNSDVLIPRFETEELVNNMLIKYDDYFNGKEVDVVDIGTGSGCLGITLALEETKMNVTCTDVSEEALNTAKKNAVNLNAKVQFITGDMLKPLKGKKFDILISNPPYIPKDEFVESIVVDNEPNLALFGGSDGLKFYRIILEGAKEILNENFIIGFEHAFDKKEEITNIAKEYFGDCIIENIKDMQNKDRMTFIIKGSK